MESRERILSSAARVFASYGFRHATFEEIAAGAGVSRTLLYRYFGGKVEVATASEDWREIPVEHAYADGNYRILGLADMAQAIRQGRPHRASGELAFHVLEVMEAFQKSSDLGATVGIASRPERPAPMLARLKSGQLD